MRPPRLSADALAETLRLLGWSEKDLATRLGVAPNTVWRWTAGSLGVPSHTCAYLYAVLLLKARGVVFEGTGISRRGRPPTDRGTHPVTR